MCKDHSKTLQELKANLEAGGEIPLSFDGADININDSGDQVSPQDRELWLKEHNATHTEQVTAGDVWPNPCSDLVALGTLKFQDVLDNWPEPSLTHEGFEWGYVRAEHLAPLKAALAILEGRGHIGPWDIVAQGLKEIVAMNDPEEGHGFGVWPDDTEGVKPSPSWDK